MAEFDKEIKVFRFMQDYGDELADYPPKDELIAAWHAANDRYIAAVENADPGALAKPTQGPLGQALPLVADFLAFFLTGHVSTHLGQLSAWRRADHRPPLF